jgi:predicted aspartyl protease
MGLTSAKVIIKGEGASEGIQLLVDTGSIYTWVVESTLSKLRVRSLGKRNFRTIEGRQIVREVGEAVLEFAGENATRIVVFAEQGDAEVMGVDTLEGLGLEVDPTTKRLRRVEAFLAY